MRLVGAKGGKRISSIVSGRHRPTLQVRPPPNLSMWPSMEGHCDQPTPNYPQSPMALPRGQGVVGVHSGALLQPHQPIRPRLVRAAKEAATNKNLGFQETGVVAPLSAACRHKWARRGKPDCVSASYVSLGRLGELGMRTGEVGLAQWTAVAQGIRLPYSVRRERARLIGMRGGGPWQ